MPEPTLLLFLTICIPLSPQCIYLLMAASSRIAHCLSNQQNTVVKHENHGCGAHESAANAWCCQVHIEKNLWGIFPAPRWIYASIKADLNATSKVNLMKWLMDVYYWALMLPSQLSKLLKRLNKEKLCLTQIWYDKLKSKVVKTTWLKECCKTWPLVHKWYLNKLINK